MRSLYDHGTTGVATRREAISRFGPPTAMEASPLQSGSPDSMIVLHHPGRLHRYLRAGGRDFLVEAQRTAPGAGLPGKIRLGTTTRADLVHRLPHWDEESRDGDTVVVAWRRPDREPVAWVELALVRDTVRLVRWLPYVD